MGDYKHGSMDISEHEKTFDGFTRLSIGVGIFSILTLIFLALVNG